MDIGVDEGGNCDNYNCKRIKWQCRIKKSNGLNEKS